jgi:hypothetical protein
VKQEAGSSSTALPPDYDEEEALRLALELSKADEDAKWVWEVGLDNIIKLSAMVAAHNAELPPPPPLPPQATFLGHGGGAQCGATASSTTAAAGCRCHRLLLRCSLHGHSRGHGRHRRTTT